MLFSSPPPHQPFHQLPFVGVHSGFSLEGFIDESVLAAQTTLEKFEEVMQKSPEPSALFFQGMALNSLHNFGAAREKFVEFLQQNPGAMPDVSSLAESLERDSRGIEGHNMFSALFEAGMAEAKAKMPSVQNWKQIADQWKQERAHTTLQDACRIPTLKEVTGQWMADLKAKPSDCQRVPYASVTQDRFKEIVCASGLHVCERERERESVCVCVCVRACVCVCVCV